MSTLLLFLKTLITYLANIINHPTLVELQQIFPVTMAKARKLIGLSANDGVIVFTVCPKCNTLYKSSDCFLQEGNKEESKRCSYVQFPNYPQPSRRVSCNTMLMKKEKNWWKNKTCTSSASLLS